MLECTGCGTLIHADCEGAVARCPTLGCAARPMARSAASRRARVGAALLLLLTAALSFDAFALFRHYLLETYSHGHGLGSGDRCCGPLLRGPDGQLIGREGPTYSC